MLEQRFGCLFCVWFRRISRNCVFNTHTHCYETHFQGWGLCKVPLLPEFTQHLWLPAMASSSQNMHLLNVCSTIHRHETHTHNKDTYRTWGDRSHVSDRNWISQMKPLSNSEMMQQLPSLVDQTDTAYIYTVYTQEDPVYLYSLVLKVWGTFSCWNGKGSFPKLTTQNWKDNDCLKC